MLLIKIIVALYENHIFTVLSVEWMEIFRQLDNSFFRNQDIFLCFIDLELLFEHYYGSNQHWIRNEMKWRQKEKKNKMKRKKYTINTSNHFVHSNKYMMMRRLNLCFIIFNCFWLLFCPNVICAGLVHLTINAYCLRCCQFIKHQCPIYLAVGLETLFRRRFYFVDFSKNDRCAKLKKYNSQL